MEPDAMLIPLKRFEGRNVSHSKKLIVKKSFSWARKLLLSICAHVCRIWSARRQGERNFVRVFLEAKKTFESFEKRLSLTPKPAFLPFNSLSFCHEHYCYVLLMWTTDDQFPPPQVSERIVCLRGVFSD